MYQEPIVRADGPEQKINIGRYLRFVIVFLLIVFGALAIYEYYYGAEARKMQQAQGVFEAVATTTEQ
jgi:hypothetical protein